MINEISRFFHEVTVFITGFLLLIITSLITVLTTLSMSIVAGTVIWVIFPFTIQPLIPSEITTYHLPWFNCICISWIINILFNKPVHNIINTNAVKPNSKSIHE